MNRKMKPSKSMSNFEKFKSEFKIYTEYLTIIDEACKPDKEAVEQALSRLKELQNLDNLDSYYKYMLRRGYWFVVFIGSVILPLLELLYIFAEKHAYALVKNFRGVNLYGTEATVDDIYDFLIDIDREEAHKVLTLFQLDYRVVNSLYHHLDLKDKNAFFVTLSNESIPKDLLLTINQINIGRCMLKYVKTLFVESLDKEESTLDDVYHILNSLHTYSIQKVSYNDPDIKSIETEINTIVTSMKKLHRIVDFLTDESQEYSDSNLKIFDTLDPYYFKRTAAKGLAISMNIFGLLCEDLTDKELQSVELVLGNTKKGMIAFEHPDGVIEIPSGELFELIGRWLAIKSHVDVTKISTPRNIKLIKVSDSQHILFEKTLPRIKDKVRQLAECLTRPVNGKTYLLEKDKITFYYRICGELVGDDTMNMVKEDVINWGANWPSLKYLIQKIYTQYHIGYPEDSATFPKGFDNFISENYYFLSGGNGGYKKISVSTIKENPENSSKVSQTNFPDEERRSLDELLKRCQLMLDKVK